MLRRPADPARRRAQRLPPPAPQGQARQPLQRLQRGRVRRHLGAAASASRAAACRRSSRWSTTRGWTAWSAAPPGCARAWPTATWHAAHRSAFGKRAGRAAADAQRARRPRDRVRGGDRPGHAPRARLRRGRRHEALFKRLATAVGKYWVCKRCPAHAGEALECLGGNGYVEESGMPRLYREAPLNSIWEGSGNVNALDVLRALARSPAVARGASSPRSSSPRAPTRGSTRSSPGCAPSSPTPTSSRTRARRIVERMALALQGSLLVRHAPAAVADAFCASRLAGDGGLAFGTLPAGRRLRGDRRAPHAAVGRRGSPCSPAAGSIQLARIFGIRIGVEPELVLRPVPLIFLAVGLLPRRAGGLEHRPPTSSRSPARCCSSSRCVLHELGPRARRPAQRHRDLGHRPVVLRRHGEADARHRLARARSSASPPPGRR